MSESSKIQDGGQAFPSPFTGHDSGMSLRDYFAAQALTGIQVGCVEMAKMGKKADHDQQATAAYLLADAMLKARSL
jgi:hypothetical protein